MKLQTTLAAPWSDRRGRIATAPDERRVAAWVALFCIGQVMLWSIAFGLTYKSPEIDSAEQFVWAFSMESGYWKHPPLPSWIMHGLISLFGTSVVLPFVAAQASVAIALALMWRLGCAFMTPERSLVALVLTSLVTYHNLGADNFNHSTVLLPFQAATLLMFHRAARHGGWHRWALAGLFAGLSMLVKYMALLPIAGLLVYFAVDRSLHCRRSLLGLALAATVFTLVLTPHMLWLNATHFLPFRYARSVARALPGLAQTFRGLGEFTLMQGVRLLPLALAAAFVFARRRGTAELLAPAALMPAQDRRFLWIAALAPLILTVLYSSATETELQSRWGAGSFLLAGWLVVATVGRRCTHSHLVRAVRFAVVAQIVLCLCMTLSKTVLAEQLQIRTRANFPGAALARLAHQTWREHTQVPLRLVVSDIWLGGNIIANSPEHVAVMIDGHHFKTPWVRDEAVERCGALVLDDQTADAAKRDAPNPALDALMARATVKGEWRLPWANGVGPDNVPTSSGRIIWGIIPPTVEGGCLL